MAVPSYITEEYVYYRDVTTPAALLLDEVPTWLLPYASLVDERSRSDLDLLVEANGGSLPLSSPLVAHNLILDNGQSWYTTYLGATRYIFVAQLPTYAEAHGGGGGGGGGDYVLPPAQPNVLGGVMVGPDSGLDLTGSGRLSVDMNELPPAGQTGQVLVSNGNSASPTWSDVDGGSF